ncbi:MAG: hypothetical protein ABI743_08515, partial [bacterium]
DPTTLCFQCHIRQADEWTSSYHYLAWRDPVFQAFYASYLDYLTPADAPPGTLPASLVRGTNHGETMYNRQQDEYIMEDTEMTRVAPELNIGGPKKNGAYLGRTPERSVEESTEDYNARLEEVRSVVTPLEPITVISHSDGLMAEGLVDGKVMLNCLRCHAPGGDITLDADMELENNTEGVFCDYCHTVIDRTDSEGYILNPSKYKQGPYQDGLAASHVIEFSRLHTKSEFCKSCHQKTNALGVPVYNAYNEWFDSPYAQDVNESTCQSCHMQSMHGKAAIQGDQREAVYSHKFSGAHDRAFLSQAATVDAAVNVDGSNLFVDCKVTNEKAGHNFPTDSPLRELVLIVRLKGPNGETLWQGKRVYSKVWGDADGNVTFNQWDAAQVLADTSLRSRETRKESFQVPLPQVDGQMYITAQLFFRELPEDVSAMGIENIPHPFRVDNATAFLP